MNGVVISVVIPVYNSEKYLGKCLDSVRDQTFRDFEVICIDDGSKDNSAAILKRYAEGDERFRITSLSVNRGVSHSRNLGIALARGEYLYFMDSDDWIDPDYLEQMHNHAVATNQNVVINCNWYLENGKYRRRKPSPNSFVAEEGSFFDTWRVQADYLSVIWCRLYRTEYIRNNGILFPKVNGAEDVSFVSLAEILQEKSYIFRGPYYHYLQHRKSLSRTKGIDYKHFLVYDQLLDACRSRNIPPSAARRFFVWYGFRIGDSVEFDFLRSFFARVKADVEAADHLYNSFECFVMKAILSCKDYAQFRRRFSPRLRFDWWLQILINHRCPSSTRDVLDGSWSVR